MKKLKQYNFCMLFLLLSLFGCKNQSGKKENSSEYKAGTFGYDYKFISSNRDVNLLEDTTSNTLVLSSPELQGRVLTSSFSGMEGTSLGFINHDQIASKELRPHSQGYGGEDRIWLGPQGGQFSIFFHPGDEFNFENWFTPSAMDVEPFKLIKKKSKHGEVPEKMSLKNYMNTSFDVQIDRTIRLIDKQEAVIILDLNKIDDLKYVVFESDNELTNTGSAAWGQESGQYVFVLTELAKKLLTN